MRIWKKWITDAEALKIEEIQSFVNGIKRDIDVVKNAIKYGHSNGLAERTVNKIKVIKKIMYGYCCFATLRIKAPRLKKGVKSTNSGKSQKLIDIHRYAEFRIHPILI